MADASKLVAQALKAAAFSAKGLARRMNISSTSLRKYGYGTRTPSPSVLRQLARLLGQHARYMQRLSVALAKVAREASNRALRGRRRARR